MNVFFSGLARRSQYRRTRRTMVSFASEPDPRQLDRGRGRRTEERVVVGEFDHLVVRRPREFLPSVAEIHAPQAAHSVENAPAIGVDKVTALGAHDDPGPLLGDDPGIDEGVDVVASVDVLPLSRCGPGGVRRGGVRRGGHAAPPGWLVGADNISAGSGSTSPSAAWRRTLAPASACAGVMFSASL